MIDSQINIFSYLKEFIIEDKFFFIFYLLLLPINPLLRSYIIPEFTGQLYSNLDTKKKLFYILKYILFLFFITACIAIITNYLTLDIHPKFYEYSTFKVYNYIYNNTYCNYDNFNIGETIIKMSRIRSILWNFLSFFREELIGLFIPIISGLFYFYYKLDIKYFIIFLSYIFIIFVFQIIKTYQLTYNNKIIKQKEDNVYEKLVDSFNNISIVHNFQNKSKEISIINNSIKKYQDLYQIILNKILFFEINIRTINFVVLIFIFGYLLIKDYLNKKIDKTLFYQITQVIFILIYKLDAIGNIALRLSELLGDICDINDFFKNNFPKDNKCNIGNSKFSNGDIIFKNIYYKYDKNENYSLENINIKIKKGEKIAFIGQSGSGKTTLIKLLLKKKHLVMGNITINNKSINDISSKEIGTNIFYIPQSPNLFNRTLYDNIVYGLKNPPTKEQIIETLNNIDMQEISKVFSEKMEKNVGKNGSSLSGGQKQIVWLLRSLFQMKPIIILDEPTAALDPKSKKLVIDSIKKITIGKTVIIITHDNIISDYRKIEFKDGKQQNQNNVFNFLI